MALHWIELNLNHLKWLPFLTLNQGRWEGLCFLSVWVSDQPYAGVPHREWNTHLSRSWESSLVPLPLLHLHLLSNASLNPAHFYLMLLRKPFTPLQLCHHNPCPNLCHLPPCLLCSLLKMVPTSILAPLPSLVSTLKLKWLHTHTHTSGKIPKWSYFCPGKPIPCHH